ncbi:ABC transporter substrate-binding protein [Streptomyces triticisoli]|uniref:ABC transporter substrate-binding protein n=1 Tax=Streptomyces triticisoli TaxID=2182797 RepID=UPI000DD68966|nr:ABC transporter substrate-binding protein [Streptomyces triticisoli]
MRHPIRLPLLAAALALAVAGCTNASAGGESAASGPSAPASGGPAVEAEVDTAAAGLLPADIKSKGVLAVASDASYRPFEYFDTDNKTMIGFDIDMTDALGAKLGLKVDHVNAGFDGILPGLAARKFDIGASAFSITPERSKTVDFVPYLNAGSGLAVKAGNPLGLKMDPMALCGHTVAAQKGSIQGISQLPAISKTCTGAGKAPVKADLFPSQDGANLAVVSGRADAVMADSVPLTLQAKASNGQFEVAPGTDYEPTPLGIAMPKGSPLKPALDAAMKALISDGTMESLAKKWDVPTGLLPKSGS